VSAELTNQPSPAIFHRQSRCMPRGPDWHCCVMATAAAAVSARRWPGSSASLTAAAAIAAVAL